MRCCPWLLSSFISRSSRGSVANGCSCERHGFDSCEDVLLMVKETAYDWNCSSALWNVHLRDRHIRDLTWNRLIFICTGFETAFCFFISWVRFTRFTTCIPDMFRKVWLCNREASTFSTAKRKVHSTFPFLPGSFPLLSCPGWFDPCLPPPCQVALNKTTTVATSYDATQQQPD